jgi:hypothetical protein
MKKPILSLTLVGFLILFGPATIAAVSNPRSSHASLTTPSIPDIRGTAQQPIFVKALSDEKSADERSAEDYEQGDKRVLDKTTADYTKVTGIATGVLVIVAVLQAALFLVQLQMMRKTLTDTKNASQAAKESADIAKLSMVASQRAYVHSDGVHHTSHAETGTGLVFWRLRPHWKNSGNTPTRTLNVYTYYEFRESPLPDDFAFFVDAANDRRPAMLNPGAIIGGATNDIFGADLAQVVSGQRHLYAWGVATYRSVFPDTPPYITKFCVEARNIMGDPMAPWNDGNRLSIDWISLSRHNCSDEDCAIDSITRTESGTIQIPS